MNMSESKTAPTNKGFYSPIKADWLLQAGVSEDVFAREVSFAIQILVNNPHLQKADSKTILKSVLNVAQTGLTLNPVMKYAYLIPRFHHGQLECCLDPSYMGMVKLLTDTGGVKSINAQIIYEGDDVEVDLASEQKIVKHVPYFLAGNEKGEIKGVYSLASLKDGSYHCEILSIKDVYEIRERSESWKAYQKDNNKKCPWVTYETEMIRKTAIKRHFKYLPKSDERLATAINLDNQANGYYESLDHSLWAYTEQLLHNSTCSEEEKEKLSKELLDFQYKHEAVKMIKYLEECQAPERLSTEASAVKQLDKAVNLDAS